MVKRFYGWIPRGPEVKRNIAAEPEQAESRQAMMNDRVPLPAVMVGYHLPPYQSDDHYGLALLATILGDGDSSRLDRLLVHGEKPLAVRAGAGSMQLEDAGVFTVSATVLAGRNVDEV